MTVEKFLTRITTNTESKAWKLLVRVCDILAQKGYEPRCIEGFGDCSSATTGRYISVSTVHKHNAAEEDTSVDISIYEIDGRNSAKCVIKIRVHKESSNKVIANRIDKAVAYLQ